MIPTRQPLFVEKSGTLDDWGRPTGNIITEHLARIDYQTNVVKNENGEDVVSKATILIKGFANVNTKDTIRWTDEFGEKSERPISVNPIYDINAILIFTKVVI